MVQAPLGNWFGKGSTNVGLRHARSSAISVEGEEYSVKDRREFARDMGHSVSTNFEYSQKREKVIKDGKYKTTTFDKEAGEFSEFLCIKIKK